VKEVKVTGSFSGSGPIVLVAHTGSNNMITLRYRLKDMKVQALEKEFTHENSGASKLFPAGSFVIAGDAAKIKEAVQPLGLTAVALPAAPSVPMHEIDLPRLAVYSIWGNTQEIGWVRHALDKFEVPYELIYKERVKQGDLKASYDLILMPSQAGSGKRMVFDIESRGTPVEYKKSEKFKFLGMYGETDDMTGGMGLAGVAEFEKFLREGGVLITMGGASFFPADFGLAPRVDAARPSAQFYAPGPIVQQEILQADSPVFYGYDQKVIPARYANGPLLTVQGAGGNPFGAPPGSTPATPAQNGVLARYPGGDATVLSGLMRGANEIRGRAAIVDQAAGKGHVLIFAGNPCYRWQNFGEFNLMFNSILNFNDFKQAGDRSATPTARR
jgi:hypothetical protein